MSDKKNPTTIPADMESFIQSVTVKTLYNGVPERLDLIQEMLNAYNDWLLSLPDTDAWKYTPCFTPDIIALSPIPSEDDRVTWQRYQVEFPSIEDFNLDTPVTNVEYIPARLLGYDNDGQKVCTTWGDVVAKCEMADVVGVLARMAFSVLFGCHPFKGRDYYAPITMSDDDAYEFFTTDPAMLFEDINTNSNRFVNSYQDKEWLLWNRLNQDQKDFWLQAFGGGYINAEELRDGFVSAYAYMLSNVIAPCGQPFTTLLFGEKKSAMIISDNAISLQQIYCRGCQNRIMDKCRDCQLPERIAKFQSTLVKLERREEVQRTDGVEEIHSLSKKFLIHDGMIIRGTDFPDMKNTQDFFMVVASTKKVNLLGLKNLRDVPVVLTQNGVAKSFPKNAIIPLLAGVMIPLEDHYYVLLGGEPVNPPTPPTPPTPEQPDDKPTPPTPPQPTQPTQPTQPVKPTQPSQPTQPTQPSQPTQPIVPPTNNQNPVPPVKPADQPRNQPPVQQPPIKPQPSTQQPPLKPHPADTTQPKPQLTNNQVMLENGRLFEVRRTENVGPWSSLYDVVEVGTNRQYWMRLFEVPLSEEQKRLIRTNIQNRLPSDAFKMPLGILLDAGFCKGKFGYIVHRSLEDMKKLTDPDLEIRKLRGLFGDKERSLKTAALSLVNAVAALHSAGLCCKSWSVNDMYVRAKSNEVVIFNNDCISEVTVENIHIPFTRYLCPETYYGAYAPDKIADCYSMAIALFVLVMGVHPFYGLNADKEFNINLLKTLCYDNPVYIFHPNDRFVNNYYMNHVDERERAKLKDRYTKLPKALRELFEDTFSIGMVSHVQDIPEVDRVEVLRRATARRYDRPDIRAWLYVVNQWANSNY